jgi:hypothetical protein
MTLEEFVKATIVDVGGKWQSDRDGDYWEIFQRGHRLRFVPMIAADMIDMALDIAATRAPD